MLYEYRRYEAMPGRMGDLNRRFEGLTLKLFERHGIDALGFWTAEVGTSNELHYLVRWKDMAEREAKWKAFGADEEWHLGRAASEENGPLLVRIHSSLWTPTSYSKMS